MPETSVSPATLPFHRSVPTPAAARSYPTAIHGKPRRRTILLAWLAPLATVALLALFIADTVQRHSWSSLAVSDRVWMGAALLAATTLCCYSSMYLLGRAGALVRIRAHRRAPRGALNRAFRHDSSGMTVLVPSYAEEPRVVAATLWSAALQESPDLRVVLLIDDLPHPDDAATWVRLEATRSLPAAIADALQAPRALCTQALSEFEATGGAGVRAAEVSSLLETYERAVQWLLDHADRYPAADHADDFLVDQVFRALACDLQSEADDLCRQLLNGRLPARERLRDFYVRLIRIFTVELTFFERKRFSSLSHEANKAMNLNSYLGLMGGAWSVVPTPAGDVLRPTSTGNEPDVVIPDTEFVLTLDADSLLVPDYCTRLVYELRRAGSADVAVIQTPYCAIPGATTMVERIAGATTDLQHLHHLGKSHFSATFWVGANAIIRRTALDDIVTVSTERGFEIRTYIQDRTVIEDTESSMDLVARGWRLVNYPERLSYSATPPDFGSLVVQRRRWANGGLIILPKTRGVVAGQRARGERVRLMEVALRVDYLTSIALTSVAAPTLMLVPTMRLLGPTLVLAAVPFLTAQASDLRRLGHRRGDVAWVQALNLVLLPVNLAGVMKSLQQAATGRKIPFARTPKIDDRVAAPGLFVLLPYLGALAFALLGWMSFRQEHWVGLVFATLASTLLLVGSVTFIGVRAGALDVASALGWRPKAETAGPLPSARPMRAAPRSHALTAGGLGRVDRPPSS